MSKSCKTCVNLNVPRDALGRRIVRHDRAYPCTAKAPEKIVTNIPDSLMRFVDVRLIRFASPGYMTGDAGKECAAWVKL